MAEIVELKLIRTARLPEVVIFDAFTAKEGEDGRLIWSSAEARIWIGEDGDRDPRRYDRQIAEQLAEMAANWTPDKRLRKKIRKALKASRRT